MSIIVATYPRSGSTYLTLLFSFAFNQKIDKVHLDQDGQLEDLKNYDFSIGTVREPVDSITSIVAMEALHFRNGDEFESYTNETIEKRIKEYVNFYTLSLSNIDLLFDYDKINSKRFEILDYVSTVTNNKIINKEYIDLVKDRPEIGYLRSSKTYDRYDLIREKVLSYDLSECFIVYNKNKMQTVDL